MRVGITSKSQLKINAILHACKKMNVEYREVIDADCYSGINDQPFGLDETLLGAENRLDHFKTEMLNRKETCDIMVSIENGIVKMGEKYIDLAVIVIEVEEGDRFYATSSGIEFDAEYVDEAKRRGFYSNTVGSVMAESLECTSNDPHRLLTYGRFSRQKILTDGIMKCLSQVNCIHVT